MRLPYLTFGEARQLRREGHRVTVSKDTIWRWRREAADRRAAAATMADPQARLGLLNAARSYDELADNAELLIDGAGDSSDAD
jgi:hypothetical protein